LDSRHRASCYNSVPITARLSLCALQRAWRGSLELRTVQTDRHKAVCTRAACIERQGTAQ